MGTARAGDERFDRAVGFLRTLDVLDSDLDAAVEVGEFDGCLHDAGTSLGTRESPVVTPALERSHTFVTRDRDFDAVPGSAIAFDDE
ncbi:MAG: type II toxin-antitoxin system VapC family toxin [Haloplanus sp.]